MFLLQKILPIRIVVEGVSVDTLSSEAYGFELREGAGKMKHTNFTTVLRSLERTASSLRILHFWTQGVSMVPPNTVTRRGALLRIANVRRFSSTTEVETQLNALIQQHGSVAAWTKGLDEVQKEQLLQALRLNTEASTLASVPEPSPRDLQLVTLNMAIPFVGFGIMDNSLLIIAGDMIDTSLGVALGISTMCAAAIGNIISDIAGLLLGTFIEDFCANHLNLPVPNLTTAQRQLRSVRFASQWGCGIGVTIGCIIGMFPLLFIDSNKVQAKKREAHLDAIFRDVVTETGSLVGAARTCLYLLVSPDDTDKDIHKSSASFMPVADGKWLVNKYDDKVSASKGDSGKERWIPLGRGIISRAILTGETLNIDDVSLEPDFVPEYAAVLASSNPKKSQTTHSMLCIPVMDSAGRPIAVIQAINKVGKGRDDEEDAPSVTVPGASPLEGPRSFTENDVQILKAVASHVSVSLQRMYEQAGGEEAEMRLKDTILMLKKYGLAGLDDEHSASSPSGSKLTTRPLFPDDDTA